MVQEPIERWTDTDADGEEMTCSQQNGGTLLDMCGNFVRSFHGGVFLGQYSTLTGYPTW